MEVIKKETSHTRPDVFKLYPLGDIHAGSIHCAENKIKDKVQEIRQDKNSYWIGMGDYADCILKDDPRFDIEGISPWVTKGNIAESQRQWIVELFKPIKNKCLCLLTGNHEESIHLHTQIDFTRNLCHDLDIPYGSYACFVRWIFSRTNSGTKRQYVIHAWHGAGAAQTEGSRVNRLKRLIDTFEADIFLMGHLHDIESYRPEKIALRNDKVKNIHKVAAITGSWLKAYTEGLPTSYAERNGYKPSYLGCPCITIDPDKDSLQIIT